MDREGGGLARGCTVEVFYSLPRAPYPTENNRYHQRAFELSVNWAGDALNYKFKHSVFEAERVH